MAPRKGPGENDHKGARSSSPTTNQRSPKMVPTWKPCTKENYKDARFYHLLKVRRYFYLGCIPLSLTILSLSKKRRHEIEPRGGGGGGGC